MRADDAEARPGGCGLLLRLNLEQKCGHHKDDRENRCSGGTACAPPLLCSKKTDAMLVSVEARVGA